MSASSFRSKASSKYQVDDFEREKDDIRSKFDSSSDEEEDLEFVPSQALME